MIKLTLIMLFLFNTLQALDIDPSVLEGVIESNPDATKERVLLAKYYSEQDNDLQALTLLKEVLQKDPKNKNALKLKQDVEKRAQIRDVFRKAGFPEDEKSIEEHLREYYAKNDYQSYSDLYQASIDSKIILADEYHTKAGYIYMWDGRYAQSLDALEHLAGENNIDEAKIRADICYYQGKYTCAARYYEKLYHASYNVEYASKLINIYIYLGQTQKAQRLYDYIQRKYPGNKKLRDVGKKLSALKEKYLNERRTAYEEKKDVTTLNNYAMALYTLGQRQKMQNLLSKHNATNPSKESLLLEAKYLIWIDKSNKALTILKNNNLNSDLKAKLMMGQIYSWNQKYDDSKVYLDEVISKTKDKKLLYDAKKARAYVYMWDKKNKLAKQAFLKLAKEKPSDREVKDALMELNHDYDGLILMYKNRMNRSHKPEDIKRLAELYQNKKQAKLAIKYLRMYVEQNPQDLEATKNLALLLIGEKQYYQGFGYLEYYTAQKQDAKSSIILAQNYYWSGFSKEALDVLDRLLKKEPENKEALELKAKILKISPRFTTSNSGETVGMYYTTLGKSQLEIADNLYFNSHYKASLMYYENYLQHNPTDHKARYRYAFALENAGEYGKAEGEFALMFYSKDSDELKYHYAYNLMKNNKLKEAKKLLMSLKNTSYQPLSKNLIHFLNDWKKDWQSLKFKQYADNYSSTYRRNQAWAFKKQNVFSSVNFIAVSFYDTIYKTIEKNKYRIKFFQDYATNKKKDKGYKTLEVHCKEKQTECKIVRETWHRGKYNKALLLTPAIDNALEELDVREKNPLAFLNPKKKKSISGEKNPPKPTITKYHDIVLAPGLDKSFKAKTSVLDEVYTSTQDANIFSKSLKNKTTASEENLNYLLAQGYYFEDSTGIIYKSKDLLYKRRKVTDNVDVAIDGGIVSLAQRNLKKYSGVRYGLSFFYKHFMLRLGINRFQDFTEFVPTLKYENTYGIHNYALEYTRQNALFYNYSIKAYEKKIKADHFSFTDNITFEDKTNLWMNIFVNSFSNGDVERTGQFDWHFYHDTAFTPDFTYDLALEGWYTAHSKQHTDFYSPSFYDSTLLRIDPQYKFSKYFGLRAKLGAGYSYSDGNVPYKYGLWAFGNPIANMSYLIGCQKSNTANATGAGNGYYATECEANLDYEW